MDDHPILNISRLHVNYAGLRVLTDVSLQVHAGETVSILGANGAGKSTLLRAIMGSQPVVAGEIDFAGQWIARLKTENIVRQGVIYVPEEKMLFGSLAVEENLLLGAYVLTDKQRIQTNLQRVFELFPRLEERRRQPAATLSGGEQQMVAIGRGLMSNPRLLMLDEPSLGLAPVLVDEVLHTIGRLKQIGMTILLVEQNVHEALSIADRGYVLQTGRIVSHGSARELLTDDMIHAAFLGTTPA